MSQTPLRLEQLDLLSRRPGVDMRQTLLRVATDLYCDVPGHGPADRERFASLALSLLDFADAATRKAIAGKLAPRADAPPELMRRLRADADVTVGASVVATAALDEEALGDVAVQGGAAEAVAVARRRDLTPVLISLLAAHPSRAVVEELLDNPAAPIAGDTLIRLIARARCQTALAPLLFGRPGIAPALFAPLYMLAPDGLRAEIRAALEEATLPVQPPIATEWMAGFDAAVVAADRTAARGVLGSALRIGDEAAANLIDDPTGEVLAMAFAALGLKTAPAVAALIILGTDAVRLSYARICAAAAVHEAISRKAARAIIQAATGAGTAPAVEHEPHMDASGTPQRGVAARAVARPAHARQPASQRKA
jgi:uncharacterized protein (DUF2336 family)